MQLYTNILQTFITLYLYIPLTFLWLSFDIALGRVCIVLDNYTGYLINPILAIQIEFLILNLLYHCFFIIKFYNVFFNAKIFYLHYVLRKQSWRNSFAKKRCGEVLRIGRMWSCEVEIFSFMKRFFTTLCFVQNDRIPTAGASILLVSALSTNAHLLLIVCTSETLAPTV